MVLVVGFEGIAIELVTVFADGALPFCLSKMS